MSLTLHIDTVDSRRSGALMPTLAPLADSDSYVKLTCASRDGEPATNNDSTDELLRDMMAIDTNNLFPIKYKRAQRTQLKHPLSPLRLPADVYRYTSPTAAGNQHDVLPSDSDTTGSEYGAFGDRYADNDVFDLTANTHLDSQNDSDNAEPAMPLLTPTNQPFESFAAYNLLSDAIAAIDNEHASYTTFKARSAAFDTHVDEDQGGYPLCPICGDVVKQDTIATPNCCVHVFCYTCLYTWYQTIARQNIECVYDRTLTKQSCVCPVCQQVFTQINRDVELVCWNEIACVICRSGEDDANLLLCDYCNRSIHLYCATPRMRSVPDGDWFCSSCRQDECGKVGPVIAELKGKRQVIISTYDQRNQQQRSRSKPTTVGDDDAYHGSDDLPANSIIPTVTVRVRRSVRQAVLLDIEQQIVRASPGLKRAVKRLRVRQSSPAPPPSDTAVRELVVKYADENVIRLCAPKLLQPASLSAADEQSQTDDVDEAALVTEVVANSTLTQSELLSLSVTHDFDTRPKRKARMLSVLGTEYDDQSAADEIPNDIDAGPPAVIATCTIATQTDELFDDTVCRTCESAKRRQALDTITSLTYSVLMSVPVEADPTTDDSTFDFIDAEVIAFEQANTDNSDNVNDQADALVSKLLNRIRMSVRNKLLSNV